MPPKKETEAGKMFSAEILATILAASGTTIGNKHYEIMATLDGSKTASAWQHVFRPIKTRAKEITEMIAEGKFGEVGATPGKGNGTKKTPAKRGRKAEGEDDDDTPKPKKTKKEVKKERVGSGSDADAPGSVVDE